MQNINTKQSVNRSALNISIGSSANTSLDAILALIDTNMVNLAGVQTLTNKKIGASNAGNIANTLQFQEIATPSTNPPATTLAIYPKSDGNFYSLNSSGMETQLGGGGSGGGAVGSVESSFATLTQFQAQKGSGWVLAQGQTVPGSAFESLGLLGGSTVTSSATASATVTSASITFSTLVLSTTATTNTNNQLTNIASLTGLAVGELISATGVPATTTVSSIDQYRFALTGTPNQYTFAVHSSTEYVFTVTAANATAGSTYTNNGQTFTVETTITGATTLRCQGTGAPLASGTLTIATGSGDATITFSAVTFGGANATNGATYTNNGQTFTVSTTASGAFSLVATGTGAPTSTGTLTKATGTGDTTITFTGVTFGAHNATAGSTYTNNGHTYTVVTSIVDGTVLVCTGTGVPSASGTLTFASGIGDATIAFTAVTANVTMSQAATSSLTGTVLFSNFAVSTTGNLTSASATISNLTSTVGIANGQIISVTGISPFATVSAVTVVAVPDLRGLVIRGKNNGRSDGNQDPAGEVALGAFQHDTTALNGIRDTGHAHTVSVQLYNSSSQTNHTHNSGNNFGYAEIPNPFTAGFVFTAGTSTVAANLTGDAETRVKAVIVNHFVRIN